MKEMKKSCWLPRSTEIICSLVSLVVFLGWFTALFAFCFAADLGWIDKESYVAFAVELFLLVTAIATLLLISALFSHAVREK